MFALRALNRSLSLEPPSLSAFGLQREEVITMVQSTSCFLLTLLFSL